MLKTDSHFPNMPVRAEEEMIWNHTSKGMFWIGNRLSKSMFATDDDARVKRDRRNIYHVPKLPINEMDYAGI